MSDHLEIRDYRVEKEVSKLNLEFQRRLLFVSTIKASITHRIAFLIFHESSNPFLGIAVAIRGMDWFEGELLRSGPHRFDISEVNNDITGKKMWILSSEDKSFRISAEEFQVLPDKKR